MSRRRYISTDISKDKRVGQLALEYGDFAVVLYTWLLPHALDDCSVESDHDEIVALVVPFWMKRKRFNAREQVDHAIAGMLMLGLLCVDDAGGYYFPPDAFYRHQSYIKDGRRRESTQILENPGKAEKSAQVAASVSFSSSSSFKEEDHPPHPQRVRARPLIFELYENAIGSINPTAAELLKEAEAKYPAPCIEDAFRQAVALNKRSWAYVEAICKRHKAKGNCDDDRPKQPVQTSSRTPSRRSERGAPPDIAEWERYARGDES